MTIIGLYIEIARAGGAFYNDLTFIAHVFHHNLYILRGLSYSFFIVVAT